MASLRMTGSLRPKLSKRSKVVEGELVTKEMKEYVLESTTTTVALSSTLTRSKISLLTHDCGVIRTDMVDGTENRAHPLERTNRSRLNHLEFVGLAFKKLVQINL